MFNLGDTKGKYHRFQYHPRNYEPQKEASEDRKAYIKNKLSNNGFEEERYDVLAEFEKKYKKKKAIRFDLIILGILFFLHLFFFNQMVEYLKTKYKFAEAVAYILLISQGFIFIKRSKKKNA